MRHGHAGRSGRARRARQAVSPTRSRSTTSTSRSPPASSSRCSARRAAARPRRCGSSPGSNSRPTGADPASTASTWRRTRRTSGPVNTVFQSYALFPHLNVEDNIAYGLRWRSGVTKAERRRRVGDALELVQLLGFETRKPAPALGRPAAAGRARARADPGARRCCCSTSRSVRSTRSCARRCRSS